MLNKVYSFLDWDGWSGERVVLRPDATIPVARLYLENMADRELAKLFYNANIFMFEESGKQNRERWQAGAELIGMGSPLADVELIEMALEILDRLDMGKIELKLSHAGLTRGLLKILGLDPREQHQLFDRLLEGDPSAISQIGGRKSDLVKLLEMHGKSAGFIKNLAASLHLNLPDLQAQIDDFVFIADALNSLGRNFVIDLAAIRGFEYYTGVIFQMFAGEEKLGGGGRYDDLIHSMGGHSAPASGFALYLDPILKELKQATAASGSRSKISLKFDPASAASGFSLATVLREAGWVVKLHLGGKGPGDTAWLVEIREGSQAIVLTNLKSRKKQELANSLSLLEALKA